MERHIRGKGQQQYTGAQKEEVGGKKNLDLPQKLPTSTLHLPVSLCMWATHPGPLTGPYGNMRWARSGAIRKRGLVTKRCTLMNKEGTRSASKQKDTSAH